MAEIAIRITGFSLNQNQTTINYFAAASDGRAKNGSAIVLHQGQTAEQINQEVLGKAQQDFPNRTDADRFTLYGGAMGQLT